MFTIPNVINRPNPMASVHKASRLSPIKPKFGAGESVTVVGRARPCVGGEYSNGNVNTRSLILVDDITNKAYVLRLPGDKPSEFQQAFAELEKDVSQSTGKDISIRVHGRLDHGPTLSMKPELWIDQFERLSESN